jgi:hypothetical protein
MPVLLRGRRILCRSVDSQTLKLSTVAGSGAKGYKGDGGPVVLAKLDDPSGLAIDLMETSTFRNTSTTASSRGREK